MNEMVDGEPKEIVKIPWSQSVWFFDIDDTLIDTAKNSVGASEGVREVFEARFGSEIGRNIQARFNETYNLMYQGYTVKNDSEWDRVPGGREAFERLNERVAECQKAVVEKYGMHKKWSREIMIKLASDDLGIHVTPELVHEAADGYWMTLARLSDPFPQALDLVRNIKAHRRPLYLITSSDARLKMGEDGQFEYTPEYSEALKRERIVILRDKEIDYNALSIGDPEDKPHLDFFGKGIRKAEEDLGHPLDLGNTIMIGDSFAGDLKTPKEQMGFGLVVLFQKDRGELVVDDAHQVTTGDLGKVSKLLEEH